MNFFEQIVRPKFKEQLVKAAVFIAPCGENNPIELYFLKEGYPYNCRQCGKAATYKMLG